MADIASLFAPNLVFIGLEADSQEDFFKKLGDELMAQGYIKDTWYDAVTTRERNYPTGLGTDLGAVLPVAIPHTDPENIAKPYMAVVIPAKPVDFVQMASEDVHVPAELIVNLGITHDGGQVDALSKLMGVFTDQASVDEVLAQTTPEGIVEVFQRFLA